MDDVPEIEVLDELSEIVGISVHVVPLPRLTRAPMTAPIMRDAPISV